MISKLGVISKDTWAVNLRTPNGVPKKIIYRRFETLASVPHGAWEDMCYDSFDKEDYEMLKNKTEKELEELKNQRECTISRIAQSSRYLVEEQSAIDKCERILRVCEEQLKP